MKKIFLVAICTIGLTGCAANNDMMNNNFPAITPISAPTKLVGAWTGSMGPYLSTFDIKKDGTGIYCYSWNGKDVLGNLKYDGQQIILQDGQRMSVTDVTKTEMKTHAAYFMGADYIFYPDSNLKNASPYCSKNMK